MTKATIMRYSLRELEVHYCCFENKSVKRNETDRYTSNFCHYSIKAREAML